MTSSSSSEIHWKGQNFTVDEPRLLSKEDCLRNLQTKMFDKIQVTLRSLKLTKKHELLLVSLTRLVDEIYDSGGWEWTVSKLDHNDAGVYLIGYDDYSIKIGMSFHCRNRVGQQGKMFAATVMTVEDMKQKIPRRVVDEILSLRLPGLVVHEDHTEELQTLIRMQLCELFLACSRACVTNTVGERLVQVPTLEIQRIIEPVSSYPTEAVTFFQDEEIPDGGMHNITTWSTFPSDMHRLAEDSPDFLQQKLHPQPKEICLKIQRLQILLGPKCGGFQNAVSVSDRSKQMEQVYQALLYELERDDPDEKLCGNAKHDDHVPKSSSQARTIITVWS